LLYYVIYGLFLLSCVVVIVSVLLQPGKSDPGALFTSSVSSAAFGPRGTQTILAKITIVAATTFMLAALILGLGVVGRQSSVMESGVNPQPTPAPAASPAASPATDATPAAAAPAQPEGAPAASPAASPAQAAPAASPATK
jgi:preprotein translocase subunit SecG